MTFVAETDGQVEAVDVSHCSIIGRVVQNEGYKGARLEIKILHRSCVVMGEEQEWVQKGSQGQCAVTARGTARISSET